MKTYENVNQNFQVEAKLKQTCKLKLKAGKQSGS